MWSVIKLDIDDSINKQTIWMVEIHQKISWRVLVIVGAQECATAAVA